MDVMDAVCELIFWASILFVFYAYAGYPVILFCMALVRKRSVLKGDVHPTVSLIITAYNEEARIGEKLENSIKTGISSRPA